MRSSAIQDNINVCIYVVLKITWFADDIQGFWRRLQNCVSVRGLAKTALVDKNQKNVNIFAKEI